MFLSMQVGPSILVLGYTPQKCGLSKSIFTRLLHLYNQKFHEGQSNNIAFLNTNYRCHETILNLAQHLFYPGVSLVARTNIVPFSSYPLFFVCSNLSEKFSIREEADEHEACLLVTQLRQFIDRWPREWGAPELEDICLIAPNRRQVNCCNNVQ